ncbi:MAG TPA: hypothetical protein VJT15_09685 [Pyrinomonadaceae bacterium]|nr:hypothetical protein [Pyrinomonadaceae bacterium]
MKRITVAATFIVTLVLASLNVAAQTQSREDVLKELKAKRAELAALEQKLLDISDADREANAAFIGGSDSGVIRLLPREKYDQKVMTMTGGGAYYSFVRSTHEYGYGSDISLDQGMLSVGFAGADYGMLFNLGDTPLDEVSGHRATRALFEYTPPAKEVDVRRHQRDVYYGIELSGLNFKNRASAKVANTYLLRSISFERSDVAVALRVTRQDTDGSVILAFKVLKRFPTPELDRTKVAENQ